MVVGTHGRGAVPVRGGCPHGHCCGLRHIARTGSTDARAKILIHRVFAVHFLLASLLLDIVHARCEFLHDATNGLQARFPRGRFCHFLVLGAGVGIGRGRFPAVHLPESNHFLSPFIFSSSLPAFGIILTATVALVGICCDL